MCSSRPLGDGVYEVTTPGCYAVGQRLYLVGSAAQASARHVHDGFSDWLDGFLARRGSENGCSVKADAGALSEAVEHGVVHESLAAEPFH